MRGKKLQYVVDEKVLHRFFHRFTCNRIANGLPFLAARFLDGWIENLETRQ